MQLTRRDVAASAALVLAAYGLAGVSPAWADSEEAAVVAAGEALRKAMLDADKAKLEELVSDQLSYGHSAGRLENKAQFIDIVAGKKTIYKSITYSDASTAVVGNNAIVRHVLSVETESDGKPASARVGALQVWSKQDGRWKLLARQAFRLG
jgi:ketosteroid isomerase-like protein